MPVETRQLEGRMRELRIRGVLGKAELDAAQAEAVRDIASGGVIRLLVVLEAFLGWERGADWGDTGFLSMHRNDVTRIALVGDPKWETEALMFVGAGVRRTAVKFFPSEALDEARRWLG